MHACMHGIRSCAQRCAQGTEIPRVGIRKARASVLRASCPVPGAASGMELLARVYRATGRCELAIVALELALKLDPFLWAAYEQLCALGVDKPPDRAFAERRHAGEPAPAAAQPATAASAAASVSTVARRRPALSLQVGAPAGVASVASPSTPRRGGVPASPRATLAPSPRASLAPSPRASPRNAMSRQSPLGARASREAAQEEHGLPSRRRARSATSAAEVRCPAAHSTLAAALNLACWFLSHGHGCGCGCGCRCGCGCGCGRGHSRPPIGADRTAPHPAVGPTARVPWTPTRWRHLRAVSRCWGCFVRTARLPATWHCECSASGVGLCPFSCSCVSLQLSVQRSRGGVGSTTGGATRRAVGAAAAREGAGGGIGVSAR